MFVHFIDFTNYYSILLLLFHINVNHMYHNPLVRLTRLHSNDTLVFYPDVIVNKVIPSIYGNLKPRRLMGKLSKISFLL